MGPRLIRVEPTELFFDTHDGRVENVKMKIVNISGRRIGYKLFNDHADMYLFQPKSGFIEKGRSVEVSVKLTRLPESQPEPIDHVTIVKARKASKYELDREKEWRLALPQDDALMDIINVKTRFRNDEDSIALRRIEQRRQEALMMAVKVLTVLCLALVAGLLMR